MLTTAYYFLQVILCSGLMMGYYWLVLRNKRFHQYNRFYLLAIALLSWVVPLVKIKWGRQMMSSDPRMMRFLSVVADNNSQIEENLTRKGFQWSWDAAAGFMYVTIAGILLLGMLRAFFRLYQLLKTNSCKSVGEVYLIITRAKGTPFSFFRYIFWNEEIDIRSEAGKQILQHELTHVRQKHSFDKIFIQVVLIAGWFNPFFWLIRKEMDMIHEFIADRKAVNEGDTASLAQMLLTAAYPQQQFALSNPFFFSPIKRRLKMLTNHTNPRFSYIRRLIVLPLLAIVVVLFAFRNKEINTTGTVSVSSVVEHVVEQSKNLLIDYDKDTSITADKNSTTIKADTLKIIEKGEQNILTNVTISPTNTLFDKSLMIVDGKKVASNTLELLDPNQIATVDVLKGESAVALYGEEGKNGVVVIRTKIKNSFPASIKISRKQPGQVDTNHIITVASIIGYGAKDIAGKKDFLKRNPSVKEVYWWAHTSLKMQVELKNGSEETYDLSKPASKKKAEVKYGKLPVAPPPPPLAKNPDIVIEDIKSEKLNETELTVISNANTNIAVALSKQNVDSKTKIDTIDKKESYEKVFTITQTSPEFPGGIPAWTKYLERNLNKDIVKNNGGPPGKYTVVVSFVISKTGTISEVTAENDPGYGTKDEAIRLIIKGPKWKPALQNGKAVVYKHRQSITFFVPES
ncbi:MAG: M56 family metallopeptidase [Sediminibacterium sp.]|nr:M56 family metallopeptidase [Sediminibacterium sp.]MDP3127440.1 M56 family metallopeptidase [Sediminibacterium sp.]